MIRRTQHTTHQPVRHHPKHEQPTLAHQDNSPVEGFRARYNSPRIGHLHHSLFPCRAYGKIWPLESELGPWYAAHVVDDRGFKPEDGLAVACTRCPVIRDTDRALHTALAAAQDHSNRWPCGFEKDHLHGGGVDEGEDLRWKVSMLKDGPNVVDGFTLCSPGTTLLALMTFSITSGSAVGSSPMHSPCSFL